MSLMNDHFHVQNMKDIKLKINIYHVLRNFQYMEVLEHYTALKRLYFTNFSIFYTIHCFS